MAFTYWLPDEHGSAQNHETNSNSVIIIGANGSGKSKLGAWIEKQSFEKVHRISGQRDLNFSKNISLKSHFEAENLVFWGRAWASLEKFDRWNSAITDHYTTTLLHDYEDVLAALIALENYEKEQYFDLCRNAEKNHQVKPETPITAYDKLYRIWDSVLPERKLIIEDAKLYAETQNGGQAIRYSATEMSDGERAVLYLVAQVLCIPQDKILVIDEPELHLHRSIMNRLWKALEQCRSDCLFIYITHDTQFAAAHGQADKIWVKEYDGQNWKLEKIENAELPDELLLDILGSRKNVLFVEGERSSYDTQLYSELYPDYLIIPCGSCTQVIARTKAFRNNPSLHECEVYGIIDRDFRSDYEIEKLAEDHIYTLRVAEVENLFIVEELIRLMAKHMGKDEDVVFTAVKKYVVQDRFANQINGQVCEGTVAQIKYILMCAEISKKNEVEAKISLDAAIAGIDYDRIKREQESKFQAVLDRNDYAETIKTFNQKNLSRSIGHFVGINDKEYCQTVIALLHGGKHDEIVNTIVPYLPVDIPR